ncbi:hypothetical protein DFP73DRAFT_86024 [Morchella snyderi]|nr:hypothetical protein DFP73DRAFT_86024 [Morchella snyderi]
MRQRAFSRPVPIKTNLPVKAAGLHEEDDDDTVLPLPLTPLTPRTEFDLRRACKALVNAPTPISTKSSVLPTTSHKQAPRNGPASASFTTQTFTSPVCSDEEAKKATLLALTSKPHPAPPPLEPLSPIQYEFATTATARKFSVINLRASDATLKTTRISTRVSSSGAMASPVLCRKPTVIDVSNRPKTADMRSSRMTKTLGTFEEDRETLALFPRPGTSHQTSQRPSTSHHRPSTSGGSKASTIELNDRPLPPLPAHFIKPVQRSKSDSEVVLKKASLGSFGRKIATFFGRGKKQEAAPAA